MKDRQQLRQCIHGLSYDPANQAGCVLCRKEQAQRDARPWRVFLKRHLLLILGLLAVPFISVECGVGPVEAKVGEKCENRVRCENDSFCAVPKKPDQSDVPGVCVRSCAVQSDCAGEDPCRMFAGRRVCVTPELLRLVASNMGD